MQREVTALAKRTFDVLVVGGGIYGLTVCADLAQRGLTVALIDRSDFGSGNSFNHLRTIHGGLRYLQTLDFRRARQSVRERRTLARIAPHAVQSLAFALPLSRSITRGRTAMRAGMLADRLVGLDRNRGVATALTLPPGKVLSRAAALKRFPDLSPATLTGAAVWYDYTVPESDRLTLAWLAASVHRGATAANYIEAIEPLLDRGRVIGVRARDRLSGSQLDIHARLTVNAAGSAVEALASKAATAVGVRLLKAMNLVTRLDGGTVAIGARSGTGRHFFRVPWRGRALFGTWESNAVCPPDDTSVHEADVLRFVDELNEAFPLLKLDADDITYVHRGLVPATVGSDGTVRLEGKTRIVDHGANGDRLEGFVSIVGTKYTTARSTAEIVADRVMDKLGVPRVPCKTATTPLPGGGLPSTETAIADGQREFGALASAETIRHLVMAFGSHYREVLALGRDRPSLYAPVAEGCPVIGAELVWALRYEMAVTLRDVIVRRTPLGALGYPGDHAVDRAAAITAAELGWSNERTRAEVEALKRFYTT